MDEGLLDTTFFIDSLRGDTAALRLLEAIVNNQFRGFYSPITIVELGAGAFYSPAEDAFFRALMSRLVEVPFTTQAARLAGLYLRGLPPAQAARLSHDAMIGTSAVVAGLAVYTRNVRDISLFADDVHRY